MTRHEGIAGAAKFALAAAISLVCLLMSNLAWPQALQLSEEKVYQIQTPALINREHATLESTDSSVPSLPKSAQLTPVTGDDPRHSFWYRFDLHNNTDTTVWSVEITNTLVSRLTAYVQWNGQHKVTQNGYLKRIPFDLGNGVRFTIPKQSTVTVWLNLQSPQIARHPLISLRPITLSSQNQFIHTTLVILALGAMLALAVYNTFLYFPTRDPSFLWYALYQLLCSFGWAAHFKLLLYGFDIEMEQSTFYLPFYIAGATSLMFAVSFLRLHARNKLTLSIEAFSIAIIVFGVIGLALPFKYYYFSMAAVAYLWMVVMLFIGIRRLYAGFRPARFFVVGFSIMTLFFIVALGGNVAGVDLFGNFLVWALWAQLFDSVALALALADRINFLRKSRQFADKRATTDQLTGLPNRMAFERDVRAWEAYYKEGVINDFFLTFIDVDGLKWVNDHKGHNEGDRLLSVISKWVTKQVQQQHVYRVGGDEFLVLSKNHVRWNLPDLHKILDNAGFPNCDLSIGTSSFSESQSRSQLLKLADERMYALKKSRQ